MAKQKSPMRGVTSREQSGAVYWYASINGTKKYCGKGSEGRKTAIAARAKAIAGKFERRELNAGLKVKRLRLNTFVELSNWYMNLPEVQGKKIYSRKLISVKHLFNYFQSHAVNAIEAYDIQTYRGHRKKKGMAEGTINNEVQLLRAMYRMAARHKMIPADAIPGDFPMVYDQAPRRLVTDDEYARLLEHADADFKDVLICAYESAMRASEIIKLTAGQVHLDITHISGATVDYISLGTDTKTGRPRTVPVSAALKEVLTRRLERLAPDDSVFTYTKEGMLYEYNYQAVRRKMVWTCKKADVVYGDSKFNVKGERIGIVFHCFRHTRTTKWVEAGFSDLIIMRATGHTTLEAYQNYVKLDPSAVMRLVTEQDKTGQISPQSAVK